MCLQIQANYYNQIFYNVYLDQRTLKFIINIKTIKLDNLFKDFCFDTFQL